MKGFHNIAVRMQKLCLHPRTAALVEVTYACHGIVAAHHWVVLMIYGALFIVSMAHLIWVATTH